VRDGLAQIRKKPRPGVAALCRRAGVEPTALTADQISFRIAPRLNAAGRMGDPRQALELLLTDDRLAAETLATAIETLNTDRRSTSARIVDEADKLVREDEHWSERPLLIVRRAGWSAGVLGAVANQLVNRFGRPAVVLTDDGVISRGSARSIPGFDISAALTGSADLLLTFGGHSQAAGLSLPSGKVPQLQTRLTQALEDAGLGVAAEPTLLIDAEIPPERLTLETAKSLELLQPFGQDNRAPLLLVRNLKVSKYDVIGQDRTHLRLVLAASNRVCKAVMFGAADRSRELVVNRDIDVVGILSLDTWNGNVRHQLEVKDFRPAE
jgi:single-stranded-DNA-specific exonuclease